MLEAIGPSPTRDEQVYASLRRAIIDGSLAPGQDVVVTTVAAQLGVSRIPVMHACQRLVGEGFLIANPRRSVTVAPLTEERITEGNEVLVVLECLALEHVAKRATEADLAHLEGLNGAVRAYRGPPGSFEVNVADYRFHAALWEAAGKPYLAQQIRLVYDHHEPARALARVYHDASTSSGEHEQILEALRRRDVTAAQGALQVHRNHGAERAISALRLRAGASPQSTQRTRRGKA
ncbi:MAG: GntR family transcriptional regulator [Chloroflexota bacterium]|nr:GntR family transcriptional regulator [Chloroflexota bacterium]